MARRLRLKNALVFESNIPLFLRRLFLLLLAVPGIMFGNMAMSVLSGVWLALALVLCAVLSILLFLFALDGVEGKVIVDADGIEWRSPLKKNRLLWNEGLTFKERLMYAKGGTIRVYDVSSQNSTTSFGENLANHAYLRSLINTGINGVADHNSEVALPPPPLDLISRSQTINNFLFVAIMAFFASVLVGITIFDQAKLLYLTPVVPIKDVQKYADTYKNIRVKGKLHIDPPVVARDDKHIFGYQFLELKGSSDPLTGISTPGDITIVDGSDKLTVRVPESAPYNFGPPIHTPFQKDWQNTKSGQLVTAGVDQYLKEYEKYWSNDDLQISIWNIEQDSPIEVYGHIKTENNSPILKASIDSMYWMAPSPNKQLEQDFQFKFILIVASSTIAIAFLVAAYRIFSKE